MIKNDAPRSGLRAKYMRTDEVNSESISLCMETEKNMIRDVDMIPGTHISGTALPLISSVNIMIVLFSM